MQRSLPRMLRFVACFAAAALAAGAAYAAEPFDVGVIVSRTGSARVEGAAQALAATAFASRMRAAGGVFGIPLEVVVHDDAGDPSRADTLARELIDGGVVALVCCSTPAAAARVAAIAERAGVPMLSPARLDAVTTAPYWSFSLAPAESDDIAAVVADVAREGKTSVALMTLDNSFGDQATSLLKALLSIAGLSYAGESRYKPGTADLRPEGLWIATREPDAVVAWGLKDDLLAAVDGLRRRGYEGPVYGRSALLQPVYGGLDLGRLEGVRFAVPPARLVDSLPADATCADRARSVARELRSVYGDVIDVAAAAPAYDALTLLEGAFEQVAALRLPEGDLTTRRQAVRDSLVGLQPTCGASGLLDLSEGERNAVVPRGLVVAQARHGQLVAAP